MIKSFWVVFGPFLCGFGFVEIMVVFVFELFLRFIDFYVFMISCVFSKNAFSSDISKNTFFHFWSFLVRVSKIVFRVFGVAFFGHFWGKIYRKIYQLLGSKKMGFGVQKVVRKGPKSGPEPESGSQAKIEKVGRCTCFSISPLKRSLISRKFIKVGKSQKRPE